MEYQKIANLVDDASNQPSKFKTKNCVEINDESRGAYNINSQIKFKTTVLKSGSCDYSDAHILVKGTITVNNTAAADADANNTNKKVIFKNCAPFTNCISKINNTQVDNAKDIDIVMPMSQYCKDIPAVDNNNATVNFDQNNLTDSFNFKVKMTRQTGHDGTKYGVKSMPQNEQSAEQLHKPILENLKKGKYFQYSKTIFGVLI